MAKPEKRRIEGGRVTPKGTGSTTPSASPRYTPPVPRKDQMPSPMWVPVLMFTLLGLGIIVILLNYVSLLPGATDNLYLLLGLGLILAGIITATQFR
jgi:Cell division protein CrgA